MRMVLSARSTSALLGAASSIPGVDKRAAEMLPAEIGPDMSRFPTDAHLASRGGMCPGQRQSAGKTHSAATRKGSKWLRGTPTECSKAVVRTKGSYLSARYQPINSRRGHAKATIATAHKILTAAYHVLQRGVPHQRARRRILLPPRHRAHRAPPPPPHPPAPAPLPHRHPRAAPRGRLSPNVYFRFSCSS
jgi:hypothetical protein